ncbi:odorant receptor 46a-like [Diabrotica virgifera virgifera]|uniref:Odorant receptor n=1 Tax=Diabrotica virgifera virgifera TaxID=50390 RepID=A0ABM5KG14_DIAVI|nr:odorant receptor 46a-like [Diabrotica virgifera virgifera]
MTIYNTIFFGVWPLVFDQKPLYRRIYNIYSWFIFLVAFLYVTTEYIEIYLIVTTNLDVFRLIKSAVLIPSYTMGLMRGQAVNTPRTQELIKKIQERERQIYESEDEDIIKIYKERATINNKFNFYYMMLNYWDTFVYLYIIVPVFYPYQEIYDPVTNQTKLHKDLPIYSWIPFDQDENYYMALSWVDLAATCCAIYNYGTDIFFFSFFNYIMGQLDILNYIILNFDKYKEKIKEQLECDDEKADFVTMQLCIKEHQRIMSFVNNYNIAMRSVMLRDFLQSSLQIALVCIFALMEVEILALTCGVGFGFILLCRLGIYYWYANEVMTRSLDLATALYTVRWYEKSPRTKSLMNIFMLKCNQITGLQIGTLTVMSWDIFIGILKSAYSFMTFVTQT